MLTMDSLMNTKFQELLRATMFIAGFAMSAILPFVDVPAIVKWIGIPLGIASSFIIVLSYLITSERLWFWSQPDISISTNVMDKNSNGKFYKSIQLQVYNDEEHPISGCYATLEYAASIFLGYDLQNKTTPLRIQELVPTQTQKADRIKWEDVLYSNEKCEIEIPSKYPRNLDVADTFDDFHFNLCENNLKANWMIGTRLHILKVRIDGRFAEKSMKPKLFTGYIYSDETGTRFEEGNWRNDKTIDPALRNEA